MLIVKFCPDCVAEGEKSTVRNLGSSQTLLGGATAFYDEAGKFHRHDPNVTTTAYKCSRGHTWEERVERECWCQSEANRV